MTINFFEPDAVPRPRDEVRIEEFTAEAYPDRWRVKFNITVTPFQVRPSLTVALVKEDLTPPAIVAEIDIFETMHNKMEFTLHIRNVSDPAGPYTLKARLYYDSNILNPQDEREVTFTIPEYDPSMEETTDANDHPTE